ncbi:hypothetical protein KGM_202959 [Danaus plexippus plexippus]|uniref:Uncharacterized protein n=1 Tax=Danaus plexippus plexippus TaxID=278856 RepID=A0A212F7Q0_DANPL|nr:hypothetical protein KGM_202959 [Danaus plexippus plexippus]
MLLAIRSLNVRTKKLICCYLRVGRRREPRVTSKRATRRPNTSAQLFVPIDIYRVTSGVVPLVDLLMTSSHRSILYTIALIPSHSKFCSTIVELITSHNTRQVLILRIVYSKSSAGIDAFLVKENRSNEQAEPCRERTRNRTGWPSLVISEELYCPKYEVTRLVPGAQKQLGGRGEGVAGGGDLRPRKAGTAPTSSARFHFSALIISWYS